MTQNNSNIKFVFFGTSEVSVGTLEVLKEHGLIPSLIVSGEDKPKGRGLAVSPTPSKLWGEIHGIPVIQPTTLKGEVVVATLAEEGADLFLVVDYGKLLPTEIFDLPPGKTLNIHYSRLPKWRGASPIHAGILHESEAWVTIAQIEEKLDSGPIVKQAQVEVPEWPPRFDVLRDLMIRKSTELLVDLLPDWLSGKITALPQDNSQATFCKKISKEDGFLDLSGDPEVNLRKVQAYYLWPKAYFFFEGKSGKEMRVVVKDAEIKDGKFTPILVVPEGKKEMLWEDFLRGQVRL